MSTYIRQVLASRITIAASAVQDIQLPPNPISHLMLSMRWAVNATATPPALNNLLAAISSIDILHRGTAVFSMSMRDLFAYNNFIGLGCPHPYRRGGVDNDVGLMGLIIPFGRTLYDPNECFPCTRAGELILRLNRQAADTGFDTVTFTVSSVELPEASPSRFVRATSLTFTPSATGDNDLQLYPSTVYTGFQVFSTTVPTAASFTTSADRLQLLLNNIQYDLAQSNFEELWVEAVNRGGLDAALLEHFHIENTAGAYAQNASTRVLSIDGHPLANFLWVDLDPTRDLLYAIDARNVARVTLRVNAGDTQLIRVVPQEMIFLTEAGQGA